MALMRRVILCVLCSFVFNDNQSKAFESVRLNGASGLKETNGVNSMQLQRRIYNRNRSDRFMGRGSLVRNDNKSVSNVNNSRNYPQAGELTDCKFDAGFITCVKLTLLSKVTGVLHMIQEYDKHNQRLEMLNGLLSLDKVEDDANPSDDSVYHKFVSVTEDNKDAQFKLDQLLSSGITKLFQNRSLSVNFIPGLSLRVFPSSNNSNLLNVSVNFSPASDNQPRHLVKRETGIRRTMHHDFLKPWMLVPAAVMAGMFPYVLLKLKMMVMNAFTFNNMILMGAILMTLRNFVFENRPGGLIKYGNHGYTEKPLPHYPGDYMGYNMGLFDSTSNFYPEDAGVASEQHHGESSQRGQAENQVNGHAQPPPVHEDPVEQASYHQEVNVQPPAQESQTLQGVNLAIQAATQNTQNVQPTDQHNQLANAGLVNPYPQLQIIPLGYNPYVNGLTPIVTGDYVANQNTGTQSRGPIKRRFSTTRRYPESSTIRYKRP